MIGQRGDARRRREILEGVVREMPINDEQQFARDYRIATTNPAGYRADATFQGGSMRRGDVPDGRGMVSPSGRQYAVATGAIYTDPRAGTESRPIMTPLGERTASQGPMAGLNPVGRAAAMAGNLYRTRSGETVVGAGTWAGMRERSEPMREFLDPQASLVRANQNVADMQTAGMERQRPGRWGQMGRDADAQARRREIIEAQQPRPEPPRPTIVGRDQNLVGHDGAVIHRGERSPVEPVMVPRDTDAIDSDGNVIHQGPRSPAPMITRRADEGVVQGGEEIIPPGDAPEEWGALPTGTGTWNKQTGQIRIDERLIQQKLEAGGAPPPNGEWGYLDPESGLNIVWDPKIRQYYAVIPKVETMEQQGFGTTQTRTTDNRLKPRSGSKAKQGEVPVWGD